MASALGVNAHVESLSNPDTEKEKKTETKNKIRNKAEKRTHRER